MAQDIGATNKPTAISIGGQPGVEVTTADPATGQQVIFIGVASQDKSAINIFRWTTPAALVDTTRPLLDALLKSVAFGAITATQEATTNPAANPTLGAAPTPNPAYFKGIPQTTTADGAPVFGSPTAPVRVVEFLDFSCPHCLAYVPTMHAFIDSYVRTGKARLEWRYVTFVGHAYSEVASAAAVCAGHKINPISA